jgi:hypothetical protein
MGATTIDSDLLVPRLAAVAGLVVAGVGGVGITVWLGGFHLLTLLVLLVPAALAWMCVIILVDRIRLHLDGRELRVAGRRHEVAYSWDQIERVGPVRHGSHEWLAIWISPEAGRPKQKFMYPAWVDDPGAVLLGRMDTWKATSHELEQTVSRHAEGKWSDDATARG